jgi:hypothetical protein
MKLKLAVGLALALLCVLIAVLFRAASGPDAAAYPSPNGIVTLAQAGERMTPLPLDFDTTEDVVALKSYLDHNAESLELIDQAMNQESMYPLGSFENMDQSLDMVQNIRGPFRLLVVKARVAELEQRYDDAARIYLQMCELSDKSSRGGVLINEMMATACKGIGFDGLAGLTGHLSDAQRAEARRVAEATGDASIDGDELLDREQEYSQRLSGRFIAWQTGGQRREFVGKSIHSLESKRREIADNLLRALRKQETAAIEVTSE